MINLHKAAQYIKLGLNIEFGSRGRWPWVTFIWCWYDVATRESYGWRLRIRSHIRPFFLFSRHRQSVIDGYLSENDAIIIERALVEDNSPYLAALASYRSAERRRASLQKV